MNEIGVQGFTMSRIHRAAWNCNPEITLKITLNHVKSRQITLNHVSSGAAQSRFYEKPCRGVCQFGSAVLCGATRKWTEAQNFLKFRERALDMSRPFDKRVCTTPWRRRFGGTAHCLPSWMRSRCLSHFRRCASRMLCQSAFINVHPYSIPVVARAPQPLLQPSTTVDGRAVARIHQTWMPSPINGACACPYLTLFRRTRGILCGCLRALEWRQSTGIDNMAFLPEKPGFVRGWAMDRVYGLYDRPKRVVDDMDRVFDELQEVSASSVAPAVAMQQPHGKAACSIGNPFTPWSCCLRSRMPEVQCHYLFFDPFSTPV